MRSHLAGRDGRHEWLLAVGLLVALALLAYGPWLTKLGFYRDDWYVLWAGRVLGPGSISSVFISERPYMGVVYQLAYAALGEHALAWHVYSLLLRTGGALVSLLLLRTVWPRRQLVTVAVAALFLLYPGFLQQTNAMTKSNQLTTYLIALVSLSLTALAMKAKRPPYRYMASLLALLTALVYQFLYEYMIGLEAGRIVILWILSDQGAALWRLRVRHTLVRWAPYALVVLINFVWRLGSFESTRAATDLPELLSTYLSNPLIGGTRLAVELAKDLIELTVIGWAHPYYEFTSDASLRNLLPAVGLAAIAIALCVGYGIWVRRRKAASSPPSPDSPSEEGDLRQMAWSGAVLLAFAQLPVIFALRDVRWEVGFDRYALHATLSLALLTVSILWLGVSPRMRRFILLGLIGSAIIVHNLNGLHWAKFWEAQRQLWWQLAWRAPQLKTDTTLFADIPVEGFYDEIDVWAPASMIYDPQPGLSHVGAELIREDTVQRLQFGGGEIRYKRMFRFPKDFDKPLVLSIPKEGACLHVIDGQRPELPAGIDARTLILVPYSRIDLVDVAAASSPAVPRLFGEEPSHGWCYLYQKASLARQRQDWVEVARLSDLARAQGLEPSDRSEWLPFLEGFVFAGRGDDAANIAKEIRADENVRHQICDAIRNSPPDGFDANQHQALVDTLCEF